MEMIPKGKLIVVGGAVDRGSFTEEQNEKDEQKNFNFFERGILRRIVTESVSGNKSRIEVITTASQVPDEVGREYEKAFYHLGATDLGILGLRTREEANGKEANDRLAKADIVMFTGGDQLRITSIIG